MASVKYSRCSIYLIMTPKLSDLKHSHLLDDELCLWIFVFPRTSNTTLAHSPGYFTASTMGSQSSENQTAARNEKMYIFIGAYSRRPNAWECTVPLLTLIAFAWIMSGHSHNQSYKNRYWKNESQTHMLTPAAWRELPLPLSHWWPLTLCWHDPNPKGHRSLGSWSHALHTSLLKGHRTSDLYLAIQEHFKALAPFIDL